ncbi:MAG: tetratricopeptide repeat protein [Ignavibacteriaceae bacterium]|nr:tetratricopeptide repeat protein [Ignavibacteriaceae bacterium]
MEKEQSAGNKVYSKLHEANDENYYLSLATKKYNEKNYFEAEKHFKELIKLFPPKAEYFSGLAVIQKKSGNFKEAEENYKNALHINPSSFESHYNLGILLYEQGKIKEAIDSFRKSIEIKQDLYLAYYNLGNIYREINEFDLSVECYEKAISFKNDFDNAYYNLGVVSEKKRDFGKAFECYEKSTLYNPENLNAQWNLALLYLQIGNYQKGLAKYEIRKKRDKSAKIIFTRPELKTEPVNNKKVFVYSEQGLGDSIQFVRYLKKLKNSGAYVIFECKPRLYELFKCVDGIDELVPENNYNRSNIDYDYYVSLLSLPLYFNTSLKTIPAEVPYLKINQDKVKEWAGKIKKGQNFNIGIAWSGASANITGKDRSCLLSDFSQLSSLEGIKLYSLQEKLTYEERINSKYQVISFENFDSVPFIDTSAVIENLDLVISVDTSVAHLAGALGRPVWVLLPYHSDWRWLLNKQDSSWYPTMKLFRQSKPGEWGEVFSTVANELKKMLLLNNKNVGLV